MSRCAMCLPALKNGRKYGNTPRYPINMAYNHILCTMFVDGCCQSGRISGGIGGSDMGSDAGKAGSMGKMVYFLKFGRCGNMVHNNR